MKWTEHTIARAIALQTLARKCVVLVDNCNWTGHECDVLAVTTDLRIIDVEVKISRADLKADAKKEKWWERITSYQGMGPPQLRPHPRKVWKHYYALPAEIWDDSLLAFLPSPASGVLLLRPGQNPDAMPVVVSCQRRATPNKDAARITAQSAIDIARLANLRMWESYHQARHRVLEPA
ncbi:hypothetical protein [Variovorax ginsengisoli]|uniref:NERD domain-containing protein n=1 Tax=Variovorax ginsengisoli TaxID=363844 RepID=A0ABT8SDM1_9BURK|nr:hypothetical protein [Variovorax ginsengisoli]MDN8617844.1 hypothetical protein [Variovorax ginsengisoli]MDO1537014.1 hypothetical protein [Variovorax ginsengisoli]